MFLCPRNSREKNEIVTVLPTPNAGNSEPQEKDAPMADPLAILPAQNPYSSPFPNQSNIQP